MNTRLLWDRWDEIDAVLNAALDLPPGERPEYVRRRLSGDPLAVHTLRHSPLPVPGPDGFLRTSGATTAAAEPAIDQV
jgi:hypothetical protein